MLRLLAAVLVLLAPAFAEATAGRQEGRGMAWMIGAFIFCPCHLPITLSILALLFGGTGAVGGAVLRVILRRESCRLRSRPASRNRCRRWRCTCR